MSDLVKRLRDVRDAYPEDIFPPLEGDPMKKTGDYYTKSDCGLITRASAQMGRRLGGLLNEAADEIERLRAALEAAPPRNLSLEGVSVFDYIDWYEGPREEALGEVERLRAALNQLAGDADPALDASIPDWVKEIARAALGDE